MTFRKLGVFCAILLSFFIASSTYAQQDPKIVHKSKETIEADKFSKNLETLGSFTSYFQDLPSLHRQEKAFDAAKFLQTEMKLAELFESNAENPKFERKHKDFKRQYDDIVRRITENETVSLTKSAVLFNYRAGIENYLDEFDASEAQTLAKGGRNNRSADAARSYLNSMENLTRAIEWDVFVLGFTYAPDEPVFKDSYQKTLALYNQYIKGPGGKLGKNSDMSTYKAQAKKALAAANKLEAAQEAKEAAAFAAAKNDQADKSAAKKAATKGESDAYTAKKAAEEAMKDAKKAARQPADPIGAKRAAEEAEAAAVKAESAAKIAATYTERPDKGERAAEHAANAREFADKAKQYAIDAAAKAGVAAPTIESPAVADTNSSAATPPVTIDTNTSGSSSFGLISIINWVFSLSLIAAGLILSAVKLRDKAEGMDNATAGEVLSKVLGFITPLSTPIGIAVLVLALITLIIDLRYLMPIIANGIPQLAGLASGLLLTKNVAAIKNASDKLLGKVPSLQTMIEERAELIGLVTIGAGVAHLLIGSTYLV